MNSARRCLAAAVLALSVNAALAGSYEDFFRAVVRDDGDAIASLVQRGFDPNARDPNGQPAIIRALQADAPQAALVLATLPGLDVEVRNKAGETPLMMAAFKGQPAVCRALIARGAHVNQVGWTALHYAASGNALEATQLLLQQGAEVDASAPNGRTPLMMAAQYGSDAVVAALVKAGADPAAQDRAGRNASAWARIAEREWLARQLDGLAPRPSR